MYHAHDLLTQPDHADTVVRALQVARAAPENYDVVSGEPARQIVQLAGDDPDTLVRAARRLAPYADGVDLNLGCPQTRAQRGHYGGYLLARRDWPLVVQIVEALAQGCDVPLSVKMRLCDMADDTYTLATHMARAGAAVITLHARHVARSRRRGGPAKLEHVRGVVDALHASQLHASQPGGRTVVLSNGNVRGWDSVVQNLADTGADGIMVGEPLLERPDLFQASAPTAARRAVLPAFLQMCEAYPVDTSLPLIQQHVQYMLRPLPPGRETRALQDAMRASTSVAEMRAVAREKWGA